MNGICLVLAAAALGVDAGWEAGPEGRLVYTLRLEQVLAEPLRKGQAVVSTVDPNDRTLRRFQIIMGDGQGQNSALRNGQRTAQGRDQSMVQFGWQPGEGGGLDYLVQISPERLETLAAGVPIIGDVDPSVERIDRFQIFVGVGSLPRELPSPPATASPRAPEFLTVQDPRSPAGQPAAAGNPGPTAYSASGSQQQGTGYGRGDFAASRSQERAPADGDRWGSGQYGASIRADGRASQAEPDRRWEQSRPMTYGPEYRRGPIDDRVADRSSYPANDWPAIERPVRQTGPPEQQPVGPMYTQRPVTQEVPAQIAAPAPAVQATAAQTPAPAPSAPAAAPAWSGTPQQAAVPPSDNSANDPVRPWMPLILTTLALFASLGSNAYLGWLAWSFFWRYRDSANELARSKSLHSAARQAA